MTTEVWVAVIAFGGTMVGSFTGVIASCKLTNFRLEQLEKKVEKHNNLVERVYGIEKRCDVTEEQIKVANHRIKDLEKKGES